MTLQEVKLGQGYPGSAFFKCIVPKQTRNAFNVAHGGALATYVDIATTAAIYGFDTGNRGTVSAKLDMEYLSAAEID